MAPRYRSPVGILEAAILLVLAGMALWVVKPLASSREAAAAEKEAVGEVGALADALEKAGPPYRRPAAPPAGWSASPVPGVFGRGNYWMTVLLPARDGWIAPRGAELGSEAARGFCVVAWPKREAPAVLRALAGLPKDVMWQRTDGMEESGDPAVPPVPRVAMPPLGAEMKIPPPPPDWVQARRRR
jgi:hypothetical protein